MHLNNWKKGDIVKIGRTGYHCENTWIGFTSELTSNPRIGNPDNFTMLYGNSSRKEYSDMNFWDCSILVEPTDEEKMIYLEILPEIKKRFSEIRNVQISELIKMNRYSTNKVGNQVKVGPYLNVFDSKIYANHLDSYDYIKVWDKSMGIIVPKTKYLLLTIK